MRIKLPKPVNRDVNFLNANSRKAAGPFRKKNKKNRKVIKDDIDMEIDDFFNSWADIEVDWEDE